MAKKWVVWLLFMAGLVAVVGAWHWSPGETHYSRRAQFLLGVGLLWLALMFAPKRLRAFTLLPYQGDAHQTSWNPFWFALGVVLIAWLSYALLQLQNLPSNTMQVGLLFWGIALLIYACIPAPTPGQRRAFFNWHSLRNRIFHRELGLILGLMLAGLAVRVYRLENIYPFFYHDEPAFALGIADTNVRSVPMPFFHFISSIYLPAQINAVWSNLLGDTRFSLRFGVVLAGALAIPPTYLLAKDLGGRRAGILAALILIGQPLHIHFSRYGLHNIYDSMLAAWGVWFAWRAVQSGRMLMWGLAGVFFGLAQYFHTVGLMWVGIFPLWIGVLFLTRPKAQRWRGLGVGVLVFLVVLLPRIVWHMSGQQLEGNLVHFNSQVLTVDEMLNYPPGLFVRDQVEPALALFLDEPDFVEHYIPLPTHLWYLRWSLPFLAIALAALLRYHRDERVWVIALWLGVGLFFGAIMTLGVSLARYVSLTIPLAVMGGVGLAALMNTFSWYSRLVVLLLVAAMLIQNLVFSLWIHPNAIIQGSPVASWQNTALVYDTLSMSDQPITWAVSGYDWDSARAVQMYNYVARQPNDTYVRWRNINLLWLRLLPPEITLYAPPTHTTQLALMTLACPDTSTPRRIAAPEYMPAHAEPELFYRITIPAPQACDLPFVRLSYGVRLP